MLSCVMEDTSLFCLKVDNPVRKRFIALVKWRWFERIVITIIVVNCIMLALYDPLDRQCMSRQCQTLEFLEHFVFAFFALEMLIKMTAMGICGRAGYFSDSWNILDFIIVVTGIVDEVSTNKGGFLTIVRLFRVLRPLRAINRVPSIRILVTLLMDTIPMLGNVLVLAFLVFSIFGIMGVQMFQGKLRNRCFTTADVLNVSSVHGHANDKNVSFPEFFLPSKSVDYLCYVDGDHGTRSCNDIPKALEYKLCKAHYISYNANGNATNTSCLDAHRFYRYCKQEGPNPYYGSISFDNIAMAFVFIYQVVTLEGWSDLMYSIQDVYSFWTWIYFVTLITIGSFFLVNLALVVITMQFAETKRREIRLMKQQKQMGTSQLSLYSDLHNLWTKIIQICLCAQNYKSIHHIHQHVHVQTAAACCVDQNETQTTILNIPEIEVTYCDEEENSSSTILNMLSRKRSASCPSSLSTTLCFETSNWNCSSQMLPVPSNKQAEVSTDLFCSQNSIGNCSIATDSSQKNLFVPHQKSHKPCLSASFSNTVSVHAESTTSVMIKGRSNSVLSQTSFSLQINSPNGSCFLTETVLDTKVGKSHGITKSHVKVTQNRKLSDFTATESIADTVSDIYHGSMFNLQNCDKYYVTEMPSALKKFRLGCKSVVESPHCLLFIMGTIIANMVCMAVEHHNQPEIMTNILEWFNIVFIAIFTLEMILKMLGIGFKTYFQSGFNCFDSFIVLVSVIELAVGKYGSFMVFRSLRLFRIFRLIRPIRHQISVMLKTTSSVMTFFALLFLFMFTFAILGMNIFGGKFQFKNRYNKVIHSRSNFDTFLWAMVTVFQVLTQEDWNLIMYDGIRATNIWSTLYFLSLMTIGYYVLLNLLVAILVEGFTTPFEKRKMEQQLKSLVTQKNKKIKQTFSLPDLFNEDKKSTFSKNVVSQHSLEKRRKTLDVVNLSHFESFKNEYGSSESIENFTPIECVQEKRKKNDPILLSARSTKYVDGEELIIEWKTHCDHRRSNFSDHRQSNFSDKFAFTKKHWYSAPKWAHKRKDWSCYLFPHKNRIRQQLIKIVQSKYFDYVILVLIVYSCVLLAMESPNTSSDAKLRKIIDISHYVLTLVFFTEMVIKVLAQGLVFGKDTYLRNGWNVLDCFLVITSLIDILITLLYNVNHAMEIFKGLRVLRATRALRPLRMIRKAPGLKLVVQTLLYSLKPIGNTIMIAGIFFFVFGILGVQLLKGKFDHCFGVEYDAVSTREECVKMENAYWTTHQYNFDNLIEALMALFVVSTKDGWVDIMRRGIDARGPGLQPQKNHSPWRLLYFVSFLLIGGFLVLNMIVGVVVENFQRCQALQDYEHLEEDTARNIVEKWKLRFSENKSTFYKNYTYPRRKIYDFCTNTYWDVGITIIIFSNVLFMSMEHYQMSPTFAYCLKLSDLVFTSLYVLEAILLIIAFGPKRYFKDKWYCFDILVVTVSVIGLILEHLNMKDMINPAAVKATRILRVVRALKLLKVARGLRFLLDHVAETIPQVSNLGLLFSLLFFVYSCLGIQLFGTLECDNRYPCAGLGRHANFKTLGSSMLTLFRIATGDNWSGILKDTLRSNCNNSPHCIRNCCVSRYVSPLFFVSFVLFAQFVLVNIVIAVLMKHLQVPTEDKHKAKNSKRNSSRNSQNKILTKWDSLVNKRKTKTPDQTPLLRKKSSNSAVKFKKTETSSNVGKSKNHVKRKFRKLSCPDKIRSSSFARNYLIPKTPNFQALWKPDEARPEYPTCKLRNLNSVRNDENTNNNLDSNKPVHTSLDLVNQLDNITNPKRLSMHSNSKNIPSSENITTSSECFLSLQDLTLYNMNAKIQGDNTDVETNNARHHSETSFIIISDNAEHGTDVNANQITNVCDVDEALKSNLSLQSYLVINDDYCYGSDP